MGQLQIFCDQCFSKQVPWIVVILCLVRETQIFHVHISWGNAKLNETNQASFLQDFSRDFNIPMFCDSSEAVMVGSVSQTYITQAWS